MRVAGDSHKTIIQLEDDGGGACCRVGGMVGLLLNVSMRPPLPLCSATLNDVPVGLCDTSLFGGTIQGNFDKIQNHSLRRSENSRSFDYKRDFMYVSIWRPGVCQGETAALNVSPRLHLGIELVLVEDSALTRRQCQNIRL